MRSPTTAGDEYPAPRPVDFQSNLGPSLGHSFNRPVSGETPVRSAPRQPGQSAATAADVPSPTITRHHGRQRVAVIRFTPELRTTDRFYDDDASGTGKNRIHPGSRRNGTTSMPANANPYR